MNYYNINKILPCRVLAMWLFSYSRYTYISAHSMYYSWSYIVCVIVSMHYFEYWYECRGRSRLLKGRGTARCVIIFDVGIARIYTVIVCGAHRHAKHANARGVWGHAPRKFWKITPSEIKSDGMFSDSSPFNAPVDTGIQNVLKCCYYLHAYIHAVIQLLFI